MRQTEQQQAPSPISCPVCVLVGETLPGLGITVYAQTYRYLPLDSSERKTIASLLSPTDESLSQNPPPRLRTKQSTHAAMRQSQESRYSLNSPHHPSKRNGFKRVDVLSSLAYWNPATMFLPDAMHVIANVVKAVFDLVGDRCGMQLTPERRALEVARRPDRQYLAPRVMRVSEDGRVLKKAKTIYPLPKWVLSQASQDEVDARVAQITLDTHRLNKPFAERSLCKGTRKPIPFLSNMSRSASSWVSLGGPLGMFALKGLLEDGVSGAISELFAFISDVRAKSIQRDSLPQLEQNLCQAVARLHKHFPLYFFTISAHLLLHLPEIIRRSGPLHCSWMFRIEQFQGQLVLLTHSKKNPEVSSGCMQLMNLTNIRWECTALTGCEKHWNCFGGAAAVTHSCRITCSQHQRPQRSPAKLSRWQFLMKIGRKLLKLGVKRTTKFASCTWPLQAEMTKSRAGKIGRATTWLMTLIS